MSVDPFTDAIVTNAQQQLSKGQSQQALKYLLENHNTDNIHPDYWLVLGVAYAETGDMIKAEQAFHKTTQLNPKHIVAFTNLGRTLAAQGKAEQTIKAFNQAVTLSPGHLPAVIPLIDILTNAKKFTDAEKICTKYTVAKGNNIEIMVRLGVIKNAQQHFSEAMVLFDQILSKQPDSIAALMNKGLSLQAIGKIDKAIEIFKRAAKLAPKVQNIWHILGVACLAKKDMAMDDVINMAIVHFEKAYQVDPSVVKTANELARLYRYVGRIDDSIKICEQILKVQPDNIKAGYFVDAYTRQKNSDSPERIPVEIAQQIYSGEGVGKKFDYSLKYKMDYRAPAVLNQAVRDAINVPEQGIDILELGCGSGLCGSEFKDIAKKLVGTDLSAGMLVAAKEKNAYTELYDADLMDVLSKPSPTFDLIIAMDVLCFFGDLHEIFEKCYLKLNDNGIFAFSVVRPDNDDEWGLNNYEHFAHSLNHLMNVSKKTSFEKIFSKEMVLRREMNEDRYGYLCLFKKI